MEAFFSLLREHNIYISIADGNLSVKYPKGNIDKELLAEIKARKEDIISYLNQVTTRQLQIPLVQGQSGYELSSAQERLYVLSQLENNTVPYNMYGAYIFEGRLDTSVFSRAFQALITRHEILRTVFREDEQGEIRQFIRSGGASGFDIAFHDMQHAPQQVAILIEQNIAAPFALNEGPLLRVALCQIAVDKWVFSYVMHHIISDGWSMGVFFNDLLRLYNGFTGGGEALPPLRIQYKDYASWQRSRLTGTGTGKAYWQEVFSGDLPVLELPSDRSRPSVKTYSGGLEKHRFSVSLTQKLHGLLRTEGSTLFMGLVSAVTALLYRYTGQEDIIIGSPVAGRGHGDLEDQIGYYVNMLALRYRFSGEEGFGSLLRGVKEQTLGAYAHQDYPFDALVSDLGVQHTPGRNALFDVVVALQNAAEEQVNSSLPAGLQLHAYTGGVKHVSSKFDLLFNFQESGGMLHLALEYSSDLFDALTVRRMVSHLEGLLEAVTEDAAVPLCRIAYLGAEERNLLTAGYNDTEAGYPSDKSLVSLLEAQVLETPAHTALVYEGDSMSYTALNEAANRLGHYLRDRYGIGAGDLVGVKLDRGLALVVSLLAILKAGGAYVPIDPAYPQDRIDYILSDSGCKVLIDDNELSAYHSCADSYSCSNPAAVNSPDDLAYVIYTSGTTGRPKGVLISHRNVVRLLHTDRQLFEFGSDDVWTLFHSCCFDFSVWEMYGALLFGGRLVIVPLMTARDPSAFLSLLYREKVTVLNQTPSAFYNLVSAEEERGDWSLGIRYVIFGGEALSPGRLDGWHSHYPSTRLINMYGITETTVHVTYKEISSADIAANISNIGVPIPTLRTYVLDSRRELVPAGVWGELYVGGAGVSRGYLNREELTGERFMDSWLRAGERLYRSGDRVRWLPHGEMEYGGRFDEQVKIRGYRIELGEIASTLESHGEVSRALVIARPGTGGLQELVAYVICPETLSPEDLRSWLGRRLPDYMLPAGFVRLEALPLTANGKIDRKKLPSYDSSAISSGVAYMAPSNAWEEKLVALFAAELNRAPERTSVKDNFFALGGDSIKGMKLVVKIKKAFNTGITIANLYQHQTVDTLAAWLQQNQLADTLEQEWHAGMEEIAALRQQIEYEHGGTGILPAAYEDMYPVTPIEQGMIYSSMLRPEEPVYYDQFTSFVQITDIDAFKACLEKLVERHAALRTRYYMQTFRQPIKIVLPEITIPVSYEDLSALHDEEKIVRLRTFLQKDIAIRLAFDNDLLWRLKMLYLGEGKYYLVLNCHHAMIDGWGVSIFSSELANLLGDNPPELRPLKHSYKDYCAIILGRKKSEATANYWRSLLLGYSRNKLPFNYKGLKITEAAGMKKISRVLDNTLLQQLNRLSEDNRLSFKAICLAAHIYLLHIVSSEKDVVTGVVTHERPELEDSTGILGCFLNTVPVRVDFEKVKDTRTLLRTVQDFLVASKPHEVHLSEVAGFISEKASGENPVFDTLFNFTDFHNYRNVNNTSLLAPVAAPFGAVTGEAGEMTNTLFDVELDKTMDRFLLKIKYTPAYFHEEEVHYALSLYERILVSFVADISAPLVPEQLLPEAERNALLFGFNATLAPYASEKTIHRLFEEQVLKTPDQVALSQHGHDLTYEALNKRANQVAACLLETGVKPGDNVGLLVTRTFDMIVGMYGILKAGGAYVPVDPEYPADRQEYIINNSGLNTLLVNTPPPEALAGKLQHVTFISLRDSKIDTQPAEDPAIVVDSRQLAYTIYTSGSTGRPKGVMIEHHSAVNLIEWVNDTFEINHNDRLLFITSMCFDLSVYDVFGILAAGGTVVIATQEEVQDVRKLQQLMVDERISFWDSVPTTMNYLVGELELDGGLYRQNNLRLVFLSGDWIPVQLPGTIRKYFPNAQVISLGGATEGTVWSNYYPIGKVPATWSSIPYGVPLKNNFFYILDDNFQPVPRGVAGELYIGGIGVARGYANDPEKTNAAFKPDPFNSSLGGRMYKTGDLGRLMADGNMEFLGRKDNQVKIRGFRVELGEIESVLLKHSGIKEAIVNVIKDAANNNQLCAYLVPKTVVDRKEVRDYLKAVFPAYMVPDHYLVLEALPLNSNGKIDRKALPSPVADESNDLAAYEPPQSALEKSIETIWKSLLKADKVSLTADFFDLGANSLSVGAFVNRVSRDMGLSLNIREVFMHPTIKGIAGLLAARNTGRVQHIQPAVEQPAYVLSSAQQRMWVLSQLDEHGAAYNIPGAFVLEGELDRIALDQAFAAVLERHEILRTVFREEEDGQVMQYVLPAELLANRITYGDLRNAADQEILLQQQVRTVSHTTFNMGSEPLVRACLYRLSDSKWVFAYVMHHIISDGWSVNLLMEELLRLYNAFHNNSSPALSPLRIQYKDYAVWQQSQLNSGLLYEHGVYWKSQLGGKLPVLRLPVDKPRPGVKTYNGAYLKRIVSKEVADRLRDYARNEGGTLFMGLLTVVNALMAAYTDQEDIILGTSVAGRENPELENQIGLYVNAVALRTRFAHTITFHELFRRVKQTTLQAYEHQLYPFDELVQVLDLERDLSRNLLFDVIVVLQNTNIEGSSSIPSMDGMTVTRYKSQARQSSQFDLSFDFFDTGAELVAGIEYNTDLFHSNTAQHIAEHLDHLLAAFTSDPAKRIDELGYRLPAQSPGAPPSGQLLQQSRKGIVNDLKL